MDSCITKLARFIGLILLLIFPIASIADEITFTSSSWNTAKKNARNVIYLGHTKTFYCGCDYIPTGASGGSIDQHSCGYNSNGQSHSARAVRLEWEHVVPASLMPARQSSCWNEGLPQCREGGRSCCEKHDSNAQAMIFDLHNLTPSIGQTNALRSNKPYGVVESSVGTLGDCQFEWNRDLVEPADSVKGDAARVWLYMALEHGLELTGEQIAMLIDWAVNDPPDAFEFLRNGRIKEIQGNSNPFVDLFSGG